MTQDRRTPWIAAARATPSGRIVPARANPRTAARRTRTWPNNTNLIARRSLLRSSFWAGLGVVGSGLLLGLVNYVWPRKVVGFGDIVPVPAGQVPRPGDPPRRVREGRFYLVNLRPGEGMPPEFRDVAPPSEHGGLLALYQKCPHLGCTVPWAPDFASATDTRGVKGWFRCPCHRSTYSKSGVRVAGPAPRSMDTFPLTLKPDGSVEVNTTTAQIGGPDNAERAQT